MVSLQKDSLIVLMEAGYVLLGMQKFKEAKEVFEGAVALVPDSEVPLTAMGGVCFAQQKFDKALSWYRKALKKNPNSPFVKSYYGEALFFKGEREKAIKTLNEAVAMDQGGQSAAFAKALLEAINNGFVPPVLEKKGVSA
jgi:tetratricopeptide (TPR) repeat protein